MPVDGQEDIATDAFADPAQDEVITIAARQGAARVEACTYRHGGAQACICLMQSPIIGQSPPSQRMPVI